MQLDEFFAAVCEMVASIRNASEKSWNAPLKLALIRSARSRSLIL
jgi:hypothetical protein